jgi:hypothetical protein
MERKREKYLISSEQEGGDVLVQDGAVVHHDGGDVTLGVDLVEISTYINKRN